MDRAPHPREEVQQRSTRARVAAVAVAALLLVPLVVPASGHARPTKRASADQPATPISIRAKSQLRSPVVIGPRGNPRAALTKKLRDAKGKRATAGAREAAAVQVESGVIIGVMGGAGTHTPPAVALKVSQLGEAIAEQFGIVLTGAAPGLPDIATVAARKKGGMSIGISPYRTMTQHDKAGAPKNFDVIKLTSHPALHGQDRPNYMGREIDNIEHSDAIVIVGGRFGTLGEFAIAADERRPIGVLTGTGGMTKVIKQIVAASTAAGKPPGAPIIYDSNPKRLITRLIKATRAFQATGVTGPLGDGDGHAIVD